MIGRDEQPELKIKAVHSSKTFDFRPSKVQKVQKIGKVERPKIFDKRQNFRIKELRNDFERYHYNFDERKNSGFCPKQNLSINPSRFKTLPYFTSFFSCTATAGSTKINCFIITYSIQCKCLFTTTTI